MELFDIVGYIVGAFVFMSMLSFLYAYWQLFLMVLGIILINKFTMWAALLIFVLSMGMNLYDPRTKGFREGATIRESMLEAVKVTIGIVIAAGFISLFFSGDGSSVVSCSKVTPYGC
ncbi:hypothetical protein Q6U63_003268 [Vibrio fluvialis]|nr:hypothetical protein [Vibrio fluvialis]